MNDDVLERLAVVMRDLVKSPVVDQVHDELAGNIHHGRQSGPLYTDETDLTLVRGRFEPEALTPIHNHGSWGIIGVYRGRDRYQTWRRLDDGTGPGSARVELVEERVLEAGDVAILPAPPQDIHAQQGLDGAPVYEFVLFGANTMILPRLYFEPMHGTAREVQLGARYWLCRDSLILLPWEERHTYEIVTFALCGTPATIIASSRHHAIVADDSIGRNCRLKLNVP